MNIIFCLMLIASTILMLINDPDAIFETMLSGVKSSVYLSLTLLTIYVIWLSILSIMRKIGLDKCIAKLLRPITQKLFKSEDEKTQNLISNNFAANLLGMGGAATPLGIEAMERMNKGSEKATDNAILFLVINATSIQLIPATIIGMRAEAMSISPSSIIVPSLIATTIATAFGIVLCKAISKRHG